MKEVAFVEAISAVAKLVLHIILCTNDWFGKDYNLVVHNDGGIVSEADYFDTIKPQYLTCSATERWNGWSLNVWIGDMNEFVRSLKETVLVMEIDY